MRIYSSPQQDMRLEIFRSEDPENPLENLGDLPFVVSMEPANFPPRYGFSTSIFQHRDCYTVKEYTDDEDELVGYIYVDEEALKKYTGLDSLGHGALDFIIRKSRRILSDYNAYLNHDVWDIKLSILNTSETLTGHKEELLEHDVDENGIVEWFDFYEIESVWEFVKEQTGLSQYDWIRLW
jgi:hypothetical protein